MRAAAVFVAVLLASTATASPITYTYISAPFARPLPAGLPPSVDRVTAIFTIDEALDFFGVIGDWSINDGPSTILSSNENYFTFAYAQTDLQGHLLWFELFPLYNGLVTSAQMGANLGMNASWSAPSYGIPDGSATTYCTASICAANGPLADVAYAIVQGGGRLTETPTSVAEPSTLTLLLGALVGFGLMGGRRKHRSSFSRQPVFGGARSHTGLVELH